MSEDPFAESAVTPERIGLAAFATTVPAFAYLGHTLFDDVLFGGLVGIALGSGTLLYLPYILRRSVVEQGDAWAEAMGDGYVPRAAAGMALTVGGFVALTGRFVVEAELLRPLLVGAVVAVLVYLPISYALPPLSAFDEVDPRFGD
ncbi:hypothetical protein HWV07_17440 [Natronomonas salina]|uniref:hypothetical protein n=1 Tax=Natronomonas salina TaxID=1710540 RepID=UPI0015B46BC9|nr:hypothetical protein [Natronomonas salina]QLD90730.1 hypothetical protein HWV07_17440 [Natronomonas salina]